MNPKSCARPGGGAGGGARRPVTDLTSVLRCELPHLGRKALVELVLAGDEGLADGALPKAQHARVPPHLVHKGFKQDPLAGIVLLLCLHALDRGTHPPPALDSWPGDRGAVAGLLEVGLLGGGRCLLPPSPMLPWESLSQQQHTADSEKRFPCQCFPDIAAA